MDYPDRGRLQQCSWLTDCANLPDAREARFLVKGDQGFVSSLFFFVPSSPSFIADLKFRSPSPRPFPSDANLLGPNKRRAMPTMRMISGSPSFDPINLPPG